MKIELNGELTELCDGLTVGDVIDDYKLKNQCLVTLVNGEVITEKMRLRTSLKEHDTMDIISFVSGG